MRQKQNISIQAKKRHANNVIFSYRQIVKSKWKYQWINIIGFGKFCIPVLIFF